MSIGAVDISYSREDLPATLISTVYFAKNISTGLLELRSVATGDQLPLEAYNDNSDLNSNCYVDKMKVSTAHTKWEEVNDDGYSLLVTENKGFIQVFNITCKKYYIIQFSDIIC